MYKLKQKIISAFASLLLLLNSFMPLAAAKIVYAQESESTPSAQVEMVAEEASPSPEPSPPPAPAPIQSGPAESAWTENNGAYTTETLKLNTTYKFPPNEKVSLTFTKLPEGSGTVTVKEHEVPQGVENAGSKDYEITSSMENGSFSFDLTLPTNDPNKKVLASNDGQNYEIVSNEIVASSDVVTIKGITHLTHFIVADPDLDTDDPNHPIINEFVSSPSTGNPEWVELYNPTSSSIDLTGWKLTELTTPSTNPNEVDLLNLSGIILAGGFLVFEVSGLNNTGDSIGLYNSDGQLVDRVNYGNVVTPFNSSVVDEPGSGESAFFSGELWSTTIDPTKGYNNDANDTGEITFLNVGPIYPFPTIQSGVSSIAPGGTVNVAAGDYREDTIVVENSIAIIGPGINEGITRALVYPFDCELISPFALFHLHADEIVLAGFDLNGDYNCEHVVHIGGISETQVAGVAVAGNAIYGGDYGVTVSWGSSYDSELPNLVWANEIYENNLAGVLLNSASGNIILQNSIHDNFGPGIQLIDCLENGEGNCGVSSPSNNTILGNVIENNSSVTTGIHVINGGEDNTANLNIIQGNGIGVQNDDSGNVFDATLNFWGDISGPFHGFLNPDGGGDSVLGDILFSPFYTDQGLTTPKTLELDTEDISSFVENGIFDMPDDWVEGDEFVEFLTILQEVEFDFSVDDGETDVTLPEGVVIERSDGQEFAWADLDLEDIAESILSGLGSGVVIEEAIQWGLPGIELKFVDADGNPSPITLNIFVGTALNGQTLNVVRSSSTSSGWTSDGIVAPATCLVTNGLCTFQATLASYFAATSTQAAPASATQALSQAGGPVSAPSCNDTKPGSAPGLLSAVPGVNSVNLNWSKAANPVTYYLVNYSTTPGKFQFGNPNVGGVDTTSYKVEGLSGGTTYYFKVRAGNGCAPGDYSNELAAAPSGGFVSGPAAGFAPGVLGAKKPVGEQKITATPAPAPIQSGPAEQPQTVGLEQPKVTSGNLFSRILGFISNFFKGIFGR